MAVDWQAFLAAEFWNNTVQDYLISLGIFIVSIAILKIFKCK